MINCNFRRMHTSCRRYLSYYLLTVFWFCINKSDMSPIIIEEKCIEKEVEESVATSTVVVSAKALELFKDKNKPLYSVNIQIKRVFKGNDIISSIPHLKLTHRSVFGNYNKVVKATGFGNPVICASDISVSDTKLLFLDYNVKARALELRSTILSISLYNLRRVEAASLGKPFNEPPLVKSPCVGHFCAFHATCLVNETTKQAYCMCLDQCEDKLTYPVCGSDEQTYSNECKLRLASCYTQRRIKVQYENVCHNPCDGVRCEGPQVCVLDDERKPSCKCETSCPTVIAPVCGSDGQTYSNDCLLRQQACNLDRDIAVLYDGKCRDNPCIGMKCETYQECVVDRLGQVSCICPSPCLHQPASPVCSSDGITFDSECELRRQACMKLSRIYMLHQGPCEYVPEDQGPCRNVRCEFDAVCIVKDGNPQCMCPDCRAEPYDPVCGDNGVSYENDCERKKENCEQNKQTQFEHRGHCMDCKNDRTVCKFYSMCEIADGLHRCVCPSHCEQSGTKVCATDGKTYDSECELRVASCKNKTHIYIASFGDCVACNGVKCKYGSDCVDGQCICPQICPKTYQSICASDGNTYRNDCEMRKEACRLNKDLEMVRSGECDDDLTTGSGEGSGSDCEDSLCTQYGGTCYLDMDGISRCLCSFSCDAIRSPVCGSDGVTYGNKCELQVAACEQQKHIIVQSMDSCDDMEQVLCDGLSPVIDSSTGFPFSCVGGQDCPSGSYCHLQFGKCCSEESSDNIKDCTESVYGCCDDKVTFAPGPDKSGCPDQCQCHPVGSISSTCNPVSKQCTCKPGVGGKRCDRCLPGYWGLQLIQEESNPGCMPCNCHPVGSSRTDCQQNTGRCLCNEGFDGHKCGRCTKSGVPAGKMGCDGGPKRSCGDLTCYYGAVCSDLYSIPQCFCDFDCPDYNFPSSGYVCADNGLTYLSECSLEKDSCLNQQEITVVHPGPCKDVLTLGPTELPYTPRSHKTTRHIHPSNYMTPGKPGPTSRSPLYNVDFSKYGRIGDLCLEDSYCFIPHSHCYLALCQCNDGYIPTYENTQCSKVTESAHEVIPDEINTCTLNPCLHSGVCQLDDNLGFRCLCGLGWTGNICKKSTSFTAPSFSGSSYLMLQPLGNITKDFYLDIVFHSLNQDGMLLFSSQNTDGTGQFISIAISQGRVEFRYDTGSGPKQIRHPFVITPDKVHQVIAKKMDQSTILIVDNMEPIAAVSITTDPFLDLSGRLYLGYLPQNLSFVSEKIGVNLGFVGCVEKLTAGHVDMARIYNLEYPSSSTQILDGLDVGLCEENPCRRLPCKNGGSCIMLNTDIYQCLCAKGYTDSDCGAPIDICTNSPCHPGSTCSLVGSGEIVCHCPDTREGQYCEYEKLAEIEVPEFKGDSFLVIPVSDNLSTQTNIEVWFLTKAPNGMLFYSSQYVKGKGDYISLNIVDLFVELRFDLGDSPVVIRSSSKLELGTWHKVSVKRLAQQAALAVDGGVPSENSSKGTLTELQLSGSLYVGGYRDKSDVPSATDIKSRFTGVIQRIYINGNLVEKPLSSALEKYHATQYRGAPCTVNPCMNGGVCMPRLDTVDCKCPKRYVGQFCEKVGENLETSLPVRLDGATFLQYYNEISTSRTSQKLNKFQFRFKTHHTSGMLMFQGQGQSISNDYITIVISDGYVELGYNLGKQTADKLLRARSSVYVSDGEWHTVYAERNDRAGSLQVDKEPIINTVSEAGASQLDTDGMLWIGGRSDLPTGLPKDYYRGYKGCLGFVFVLDKNLQLHDHKNGLTSLIQTCHS